MGTRGLPRGDFQELSNLFEGGLLVPSKAQLAIEWPVYRPRGWGLPSNAKPLPRPWFGLDTERDAKTGDFVCGFAVGETIQKFSLFTDLIPGTYWVWNLGYDAEGMLRDLNLSEAWAARADGAPFPLMDGECTYYHGKRLSFKSHAGKWSFLEASSFFGRAPLASIGAKENMDASKMSLVQYLTDAEYRQNVDKYCIQDARIVYDAITELDLGVKTLGVDLGATPGATARRFLNRLGKFPPLIWQTHKAFLRSYCGGRFEITKRGVLPNVSQYDIVSAYPWALSKCPWLSENAQQRLTRRFSDNALYGSYEIEFEYDNYLGIAPRWRGAIRVYSAAENRTWVTRPELEYLLRKGAKVKVLQGLEVFDENATNLWEQVILELFAMKKRGKKTPEGMGAKIVLNSQYGVLIQLVRRSGVWKPIRECANPVDFAGVLGLEEPPKEFEGGKFFAPVYAAHLTGLTRVKLLEAAEEAGPERYIGGHTDSVLCIGTLKNGLSEELGGWKLEKTADKADVCKTGMYAIGSTVKVRGITRKGTSEILWQDTHLRKSRTSIKSAANWNEVSVILPKEVKNNFETEMKRLWDGPVTRGMVALERFVDSQPLRNVGK